MICLVLKNYSLCFVNDLFSFKKLQHILKNYAYYALVSVNLQRQCEQIKKPGFSCPFGRSV